MFENVKIIQSTFTQQERDLMGLDDELEQLADSVTCFYEKINDVPVSYFELAEYRTHFNASVGTRGDGDYRHKGYGNKCVQQGLTWYNNAGYHIPIFWFAAKENTSSQKLAEKNGFKIDEQCNDEYWIKYIYINEESK